MLLARETLYINQRLKLLFFSQISVCLGLLGQYFPLFIKNLILRIYIISKTEKKIFFAVYVLYYGYKALYLCYDLKNTDSCLSR